MSKLIYNGYKFPLTEVSDGFGYMGTMAVTKNGEYLQCHYCGELKASLATHIKAHKLTVRTYKEKYGLSGKTKLVSPKESQRRIARYKALGIEHHKTVKKNFDKWRKEDNKQSRQHFETLEKKNLKGTCPDQLIDKVQRVAKELGKSPSSAYYKKNYPLHYHASIRMYGTFNSLLKLAKLKTFTYQDNRLSEAFILERLRNFYETNGRTPMSSDLGYGMPSHRAVIRGFGTLNNARAAAGVPIVVRQGNKAFTEVPLNKAKEYSLL